MKAGATFDGAAQLRDSLGVASAALENLQDADYKAADLVAQAVVVEAPRLTGFLATTVGAVLEPGGFRVVVEAPYSAAVNALDPFKARALDAASGQVIDLYIAAASDAVDLIQGA